MNKKIIILFIAGVASFVIAFLLQAWDHKKEVDNLLSIEPETEPEPTIKAKRKKTIEETINDVLKADEPLNKEENGKTE
jgi:hypothetical protein